MRPVAARPELRLRAQTAADLMMENPVSIREDASVREAIMLFTNKGFSAAPVIDAAGRPVGVISSFDVIIHERTNADWTPKAKERSEAFAADEGTMRVRDLMTPAVFSVSPDTAVPTVVEEMLALKVHRLFVVDADGVLIGVISGLDVLRHLHD
jgi:CBS domain-containing protein